LVFTLYFVGVIFREEWEVIMDIRWEDSTGWPSQLNLIPSLSAYVREDRVKKFKIGITSNPEQRKNGYSNAYDEMLVLYCTDSKENVRVMEKYLTDNYKPHYRGCKNEARGKGPLCEPPFYCYIVRKFA